MLICPNCGYEDEPCWRQRMYHLYTDYCKLDELMMWNPQLAAAIESSMDIREMGSRKIMFVLYLRMVTTIEVGSKLLSYRLAKKILFYSDGVYNYGLREDNTVIRIARKVARSPDSLKEPPKETGHKRRHK